MDQSSNEDASRYLRDILNIGGEPLHADNGLEALSVSENTADSERLKNDSKATLENTPGTDPFDSFIEQDSPRISLDPVHQLVHLTSDESKGSVVIYGNEVHITTNEIQERGGTAAGSNRVRINPVVNFDWESKYYNGSLLSVCSKYMSYALKGKSGFVVRILNRNTLQKALIKGFSGSIEDVCFAHYNSNLLACIDSAGDVFVWTISEDNNKIIYNLKLHVKRNDPTPFEGSRLVWCPYIEEDEPEDGEENVAEQILAVTVGSAAEVFHISVVTEAHGDVVHINDVKNGFVRIENGHTKFIGDIALAPDGSVLATASEDGVVKFWQLDFESPDPPRCLHEWQPHDGQPVSRLIFCDNHLVQDDKNPFWRFLMTGANYNSELKIWCTVTWTCLQTIRFQLPASELAVDSTMLKLKACLDLSAKYLVLSDISRKVLYVFLLHENLEEGKAHVTSLAHFFLTQPLLSFVITEARMFRASARDSMDQNGANEKDKVEDEEDDSNERGEVNEDVKLLTTIKIKLHCIHPKAMQELTVQYHPFASIRPTTPSSVATSSMTPAETGIQDGLSDVSGLDTSSTEVDDVETKLEASCSGKPNLIAPNAFTSSVHEAAHGPTDAVHAASDATSMLSSITSVTSINNSFTSVSVEELLGKSPSPQVSESTCTYKTCEDRTLQDEPSQAPESFSSWSGRRSPLGLPLPESPDPAKVPFPAFKTSNQGDNRNEKEDMFSAIAHSTPLRRRSTHEENEEDTDKTPPPTAAEVIPTKEDGTTSEIPYESLGEGFGDGETDSHEGKGNEQPLSSASDTGTARQNLGLCSESASNTLPGTRDIDEATVAEQSSQSSSNNLSRADTQLSRRSDSRSKLTVTPRKQVNILPDDSLSKKVTDNDNSSPLNEILSLLRTQQAEINQLTTDLQNQQRKRSQEVSDVLREEVAMLESVLSSKIETALAEYAKEQDQVFERFACEKQADDKQRHEKLISTVTASLMNKVEKVVKNEIKNSVGSGLQKIIPPLQNQLNTTMADKLMATDAVLKESIQKMVKDKSVVDAIGDAVSEAIQTRLQVTLSEFFTNSMLPGFENACQALYTQMNVGFQKGTQQYLRNLENYAENQKELQKEQRDPIVQQLQSLVQAFQASSEKLSTSMSGSLLEMMQTQLTASMKRLQSGLLAQLQDDLTKSLQQTIQNEVHSSMMEHSVREAVNEQSPHVQQRRAHLRIQQLIAERQFCEAFQEALTAADLSLVVMVCQSCDPGELFAQNPCPLSQPILLSLIQQLSTDLSSDTELKHRYLEEAVVALDNDDPITREHVAKILKGLCQQIAYTIQMLAKNDPSSNLQRPLKRLLMAAQSLIR